MAEWIMIGVPSEDPSCIHDMNELYSYIDEVGFIPLFKNDIEGFSVEEHSDPKYWWSDDPVRDQWIWRQYAARDHKAAYGKFFGGKAGFISLEWLPVFANFRRDGYDFDALWDDELAQMRHKKVMDCFEEGGEYFSYEVKAKAGFGKDGLKNFEGIVTSLQDKLYLTVSDFRQKKNKKGQAYGWNVALYMRPEDIWGYDAVTSEYRLDPEESYGKIMERMKQLYPAADRKKLDQIIGKPKQIL